MTKRAKSDAGPTPTGVHRSTVVFAVVFAIVLMLANIAAQSVYVPDIFGAGKYGSHFGFDVEAHFGWPWTFSILQPSMDEPPRYWLLSLPTATENRLFFSLSRLLLNIGCGVAILFVGCVAWESRRRRLASLFQITILDVAVILGTACIAAAYVRSCQARRQTEEQVVDTIGELGNFSDGWSLADWQPVGPAWLHQALGTRAEFLPRYVVGIDIDGSELSHVIGLNDLRVIRISDSISNDQLAMLQQIPELEALDMCLTNIVSDEEWTDESTDHFAHLPDLPRLRGLNLYGTSFRGDGLDNIPNIENLDLFDTDVADTAMPKIGRLMKLRCLSLGGTSITDAGLQHLAALPQLNELYLGGAQISDDGLRHLWSLKSLKILGLSGTRVTEAGVNALREHLPDCEVYK